METDIDAVELATGLTIAWLGNAHTRASVDDVTAFLGTMHEAVAKLASPAPAVAPDEEGQKYTPAVTSRKSLASPDHIISMIDGKPYKTLRRHLATRGLTPEEYRQRYNLKADYPMVAASYSEARRAMAKTIGLGRKAGQRVGAAAEPVVKKARKNAKAAPAAAKGALGAGKV